MFLPPSFDCRGQVSHYLCRQELGRLHLLPGGREGELAGQVRGRELPRAGERRGQGAEWLYGDQQSHLKINAQLRKTFAIKM